MVVSAAGEKKEKNMFGLFFFQSSHKKKQESLKSTQLHTYDWALSWLTKGEQRVVVKSAKWVN